jgi:hypothetical protein
MGDQEPPFLAGNRTKFDEAKASVMILQMRFMAASDFPENASHGSKGVLENAFVASLQTAPALVDVPRSTMMSWAKSISSVARQVEERATALIAVSETPIALNIILSYFNYFSSNSLRIMLRKMILMRTLSGKEDCRLPSSEPLQSSIISQYWIQKQSLSEKSVYRSFYPNPR